ncbi:GFA family protein [Rhizobium sp. TH2]|uniref:GFA family protein n=1 Tax=Rhizobium sp. TH2 TaxID=2775403 RepID=UPI002158943F|nr:GFA family protein [Rhizobium sp. TH2]UVC09020.1 GFA family protein [Rhizobium sp. TH2]
MHIDGQCHCGHVRYEAEIDPDRVTICHCTDCQRLTGGAYRVTVIADSDKVKLTANRPKLYTKHAQSGRARLLSFCPECGSPLFSTGEGKDAARTGIRVGTINQRRELTPKRQIWCRSALPWINDIADLPGTEQD